MKDLGYVYGGGPNHDAALFWAGLIFAIAALVVLAGVVQ